MSLDEAAIAANRFGLGARPGDLKAIAGDPRGWLKAQLTPEAGLPAPMQTLPTTLAASGEFTKWLIGLGLVGKGGDFAKLYQAGGKGGDMAGGQMAGAAGGAGGDAQKLGVEQSYIKYFGPGYADAGQARFETATTRD